MVAYGNFDTVGATKIASTFYTAVTDIDQ